MHRKPVTLQVVAIERGRGWVGGGGVETRPPPSVASHRRDASIDRCTKFPRDPLTDIPKRNHLHGTDIIVPELRKKRKKERCINYARIRVN
jgi:hypothetical protein